MTSDVVERPPLVPHWIDGKPDHATPERVGDVYDPATGKLTKNVAFASPTDVDRGSRGGVKGLCDLAPHLALATLETALLLPSARQRARP